LLLREPGGPGVDGGRREQERPSRLGARDPLSRGGLSFPLEDGAALGRRPRRSRPREPDRRRLAAAARETISGTGEVDGAAVRAISGESQLWFVGAAVCGGWTRRMSRPSAARGGR